ncbi:M15 family metallopeptidase [Seinonella peptonophila]|nr:M15 family metallopeptidase [Seinonella peptonophila]
MGWLYVAFNEMKYNLKGLHPTVKQSMEQLIKKSKQRGIEIRITEGFRSINKQNQLYQLGRSKPGAIVTYAKGGQSYHNYGLAIDFAIYDPKRRKIIWDLAYDGNQNGKSDWMEVVTEAKKLGFDWGGDWQGFKDTPHLEMTFGQTIWELYIQTKTVHALK